MTLLDEPAASAESASDCELTILMPCLDEAETVGQCIREARAYLDRSGVAGEVVVADNGSTDGSRQIAAAAGARVVPAPERGYGGALRAGIAAAQGRYVVMADADGSYDFARTGTFLQQLRAGHDLVMGNRFAGGISPGAMPALHRYLGNPLLSGLGRALFHVPIGDFHCGMRGFRRAAILELGLRTTGMEFASEMVVRAQLAGLRITEVPTTLRKDGRSRPPHLKSWRDGWRHLRFLSLYCPRWLLFYPGLLLMVVGAVTMAFELIVPGQLLPVDAELMLYASGFLVIGYMVLAFAVAAKTFAVTEGLMPRHWRLDRLYEFVHFETGLGVGAAMIVVGVVISVWSVTQDSAAMLTTRLQVLIPSVTLVMLGIETLVVSCMLSLMGLRRSEPTRVSADVNVV